MCSTQSFFLSHILGTQENRARLVTLMRLNGPYGHFCSQKAKTDHQRPLIA
jgi:hypothetical protein